MTLPLLAELTLRFSLVLILVLALRPLLAHLSQARWRYAMWLMPILACLVPRWTIYYDNVPSVATWVNQYAVASMVVKPGFADNWLLWSWAAGFIATLMWLVVRHKHALTQMNPGSWLRDEYLSGKFGVDVLMSPFIQQPMCFGIFHRKILLPEQFHSCLDAQGQAFVLCHEYVHAKRYDVLARLVGELVRAVFWFNPLVYFALSRFHQDQERACDAEVLLTHETSDFHRYGLSLIDINIGNAAGHPLATTASNHLKDRIIMISNSTKPLGRYGRLFSVLCFVTVIGISIAIAGESAVIAPTEITSVAGNAGSLGATAHPVAKAAGSLNILSRMQPRYPRSAAEQGVEGAVRIAFFISNDGKARDMRVISSQPEGVFDKVAIVALRQWEFEPLADSAEFEQEFEFLMD